MLPTLALLVLAILSSPPCRASPEDHVEALKSQLESVLRVVDKQEATIFRLLQNVETLTDQVRQLESRDGSERTKSLANLKVVSADEKTSVPRTCEEIRSSDPSSLSGYYYVDPDGAGSGDYPIHVYCDMTTGSTFISHDSENMVQADQCFEPGCYSRNINYNATMRQMVALAQLSKTCRQSVRFDCLGVPLELEGVAYGWWDDRNSVSRYYWAGAYNASYHTCQCGILTSCHDPSLKCNCDSVTSFETFDQGVITDKDVLPVTRLNFGRTSSASTYGRHTLGKLECNGRTTLDRMPESCEDLWLLGHTLSGFYSVKGNKVLDSVYCDFSKLPGDQGHEIPIGQFDLKTTPVYFYVQRNNQFTTLNVSIPFEYERVNVGGAFDKDTGVFKAPKQGIYYFSVDSQNGSNRTHLDLYINGEVRGTAVGASGDTQAMALSWMYNMAANDTAELRLRDGFLQPHQGWYSHFSGFLLHQDVSFDLFRLI